MNTRNRPLAVVTGASSGIGLELATCCAAEGFDLVVAADGADIEDAAATLRDAGADVTAVQVDLSTIDGVARLVQGIGGRPVDALLANAGHGLGDAFLEQSSADIHHLIGTNITGTVELVHRIGQAMRDRGAGRILMTGSIAGFMPGTFQAVYNASKAFVDSFAVALRHELKDSGVTVTCLMPGVTDTAFFERAGMLDTKVGKGDKADPAKVARLGFDAMMKGSEDVVPGIGNKAAVAMAGVTPSGILAEQHRKMAEPASHER
ncbi:MAG: SDR family NAD(P)-dependent oxidoreductase [Lautropia sp.]